MLVRTWRFATLTLTTLNTGMAFGHVLEMPTKRTLDASDYATVQSIYRTYGSVGAAVEAGSVLTAAGLAALVHERRPALPLTLVGAGCLAAALGVWFSFVAPMNAAMRASWSPASMLADWQRVRDQWEYAHAVRFVLQFVGLGALLLSVLAETPERTHSGRPRPRPSA